ncbi:MAG TPA: hypothetical protein VFD62_18590 [Pyrinomonadaceae bacterium]|nr:hypothetical protein [Pyrinomonadaceae bacterium]
MNSQRSDEEILTSGLQLLAEEMASHDAPPEIEQKLREAFRARAVVVPMPVKRKYTGYWVAAGIAAVLLIAVSVIALRSRTDPPKPVNAQQTEQPRIKEEEPRPVLETPKVEEVVAQKPRRRTVRRPANSAIANHVNREIATDFMPLGYLNPATLQDGGQIIRVELPRSSLANFGLPVNMNRYHEKVKADVLLGADGLAHAIRFVQ